MNDGLDRVEGIEDALGSVEVTAGGVKLAQGELNSCDSDGGKDESVLGVFVVDLLGDFLKEGELLLVV